MRTEKGSKVPVGNHPPFAITTTSRETRKTAPSCPILSNSDQSWTYDIEMSTNLNNWTSLTSIVATTLPTGVADLTATNASFRFYRAVSSP